MTATRLALPPRYRGTELIASGGMADVYVSTDEMLDRRVAIKVLSDRFAADPEIRARFTREARIAARLSNEPNVVTIFDVAEVEQRPAIVMEYLPGGTIADRMHAGRVSTALSLVWLEQAARALDAAHAAGVIHRDVKPANLMLSAEDELRVTDFGIARIAGDVSLTSAGTVIGTSGYMSPEQAVGGTATAASDRYALAVVAFELLSGRRPYMAETFASEAAAHATAPIPLATAFDPSLPASLDAALRRGLAKDPADRYRSCAELVAALRGAFSDSAGTTIRAPLPPAAPVTRMRRRAPGLVLPVAVLGVLALLGLLTAAVAGRGDSVASRPTTVVRTATVESRPEVRTVTIETLPAGTPAAAPATTAPAPPATDGASLNDRGYRLLRSGDATAALPLLERAVADLEGSGSLTEAYASYNLALARFATGDCDGVEDLLKRSRKIQGKRREIEQLRRDVDKSCHGKKRK